ncbi:MAG TPA: hypothetical protein VEC11_07130 [Allosphingosinicella sp.]|nr:hypothetical protein [Allosphingosinicella sp.]
MTGLASPARSCGKSGRADKGWRRLRHLLAWIAFWFWAGTAQAAVEIRFHSKDFGATFPHAFIVLTGTLDATGEPVDANFGFTVRNLIGPSALFGAVEGIVESAEPPYIESANFHFALMLSDDEYRRVMALVERWRALPQPSYRLMRRNCVSFVAEIATLLGLSADPRGLMRRPRAFLDRVRQANAATIAARAPRGAASAGR